MKEKIICTICGKQMDEADWEWDGEDAHKDCVLKRADNICSAGCSYFSIAGEDDTCRDCGENMTKITEKDLKAYKFTK